MMNGVEVRCPFLDSDIIKFAFNCKWNKKIQPFFKSQWLKKILKEAVKDIIPENLLSAPKRGFGFGIKEKEILLGPWEKHAKKILNQFPNTTAIDPIKVKKIWNLAKNDKTVSWDLVMKLVSLGTFIDKHQLG